MKKIGIISIILIIFFTIVVGILKSDYKAGYIYNGENDNWKVEYITSQSRGYKERNLKFTYKGDLEDLKSFKVLKYSYKTDVNHGNGEIELGNTINEKAFEHSISAEGPSDSSDILKEDSVVVTISLDEKVESIELK